MDIIPKWPYFRLVNEYNLARIVQSRTSNLAGISSSKHTRYEQSIIFRSFSSGNYCFSTSKAVYSRVDLNFASHVTQEKELPKRFSSNFWLFVLSLQRSSKTMFGWKVRTNLVIQHDTSVINTYWF